MKTDPTRYLNNKKYFIEKDVFIYKKGQTTYHQEVCHHEEDDYSTEEI